MVAGRWRCSTSIFAFLPRLTIFLWPLPKTCHFRGIWKKEVASELYIYKRFPPKDLENFYYKIWHQTRMRACKVVPQGRELKTLAISIKNMLMVAGGEVAVFHSNFCFPSKVENFPVWYSFFSGHLQDCLLSFALPHIGHFKGIWKNIEIFPTN